MSTMQSAFPNDDATTEGEEMTSAEHEGTATGDQECFDPRTCCDEHERLMIEAMRAYLRPEQAPECLYERLRVTLDECCGTTRTEHTIIHHTVIRRHGDA